MKTIYPGLLAVLFTLMQAPFFAQSGVVRLGLGASHLARQDRLFTPFVHSGVSVQQLDLGWRRSARLEQFAELHYGGFAVSRFDAFEFTSAPETEPYRAYPHGFTFVDLRYGIGKKWPAGHWTLAAGGALDNDVDALSYQFGRVSFFGYFAAFSLSPWFEAARPLGAKGRVELSVSTPLASWTARSPYLVNDDEFIENTLSHSGLRTFLAYVADGSFVLPDRFQKLGFSAAYTHTLGRRWTAGLRYRFQGLRHTEPLTLISYQNDLRLEVGLRF